MTPCDFTAREKNLDMLIFEMDGGRIFAMRLALNRIPAWRPITIGRQNPFLRKMAPALLQR